jgi:nucleotide-binding universal stress UspA family protein
MKTVLAAVDGSLAVTPVLAAARGMARLLGAQVVALHVQVAGGRTPRSLTQAAGVPLRVVSGGTATDAVEEVAQRLVEAGSAEEVAALVIGARGMPGQSRPLGATAVRVATTVRKPVVVVPPEAEPRSTFQRVLVPLEGNLRTDAAPRAIVELAPDAGLDVVVLHILGPHTIPAVSDQPHHEQAAWAREFLARYFPWGIDVVNFTTQVGRSEDIIPDAVHGCGCDLVALGWSQELGEGRARVVRATVERSHVPVVLIPVPADVAGERTPAGVGVRALDGSNGPAPSPPRP